MATGTDFTMLVVVVTSALVTGTTGSGGDGLCCWLVLWFGEELLDPLSTAAFVLEPGGAGEGTEEPETVVEGVERAFDDDTVTFEPVTVVDTDVLPPVRWELRKTLW